MIRIFISSVQKELAAERRAVKDFILHDPLLSRFIGDVFLFEDLPASDRRTDQVYLDQVDRCGIYIGIYGLEYGMEDAEGLSPTPLTTSIRERSSSWWIRPLILSWPRLTGPSFLKITPSPAR